MAGAIAGAVVFIYSAFKLQPSRWAWSLLIAFITIVLGRESASNFRQARSPSRAFVFDSAAMQFSGGSAGGFHRSALLVYALCQQWFTRFFNARLLAPRLLLPPRTALFSTVDQLGRPLPGNFMMALFLIAQFNTSLIRGWRRRAKH